MVKPEDITIDCKDGKYYIIMHSDEIEFRSNDLDLAKAITIRDRMIKGSEKPQVKTIAFATPNNIPPEFRQFFQV